MTEEAAQAKYTEVREQYKVASTDMQSLESLKEVRTHSEPTDDSLCTWLITSAVDAISTSEQRL